MVGTLVGSGGGNGNRQLFVTRKEIPHKNVSRGEENDWQSSNRHFFLQNADISRL